MKYLGQYISLAVRVKKNVSGLSVLINPRHACAVRVTVVGLCVCVCVCVSVCLSVCLSTGILALQATGKLMSNTSGFRTRA